MKKIIINILAVLLLFILLLIIITLNYSKSENNEFDNKNDIATSSFVGPTSSPSGIKGPSSPPPSFE